MPRYLIERNIPGVHNLSPEELQGVAQKSCGVLEDLGPKIQWVESFVSQDRSTCVYIAPDEAMVRRHAEQSGFPADKIIEVKTRIDPLTAEEAN